MFFNILFSIFIFFFNVFLFVVIKDSWDRYRTFDVAKDKWTSIETTFISLWIFKYDKIQHFLVGCILGLASSNWFSFTLSITASTLWEVKDGTLSYKQLKKFGGDGFSIKDLFAQLLGLIITYTVLQ